MLSAESIIDEVERQVRALARDAREGARVELGDEPFQVLRDHADGEPYPLGTPVGGGWRPRLAVLGLEVRRVEHPRLIRVVPAGTDLTEA